MGTQTFLPIGTAEFDGTGGVSRVEPYGVGAPFSWADIHDGVGNANAGNDYIYIRQYAIPGVYYAALGRAFAIFDIGTLTKIPTNAQVKLYVDSFSDSDLNISPSLALYGAFPANPHAIVDTDYQNLASVLLSDIVPFSALAIGWITFNLNAAGIIWLTEAMISGQAPFSIRNQNYDAINNAPPIPTNSGESSIIIDAGIVYSQYQPQLLVTTSDLAVETDAATNVTPNSATLNGKLDNDGADTPVTCGFQYGLTTSYGSTVSVGTVTQGNSFLSNLIGLLTHKTYHFRAYATGVDSITVYGSDLTFNTNAGAGVDTIFDVAFDQSIFTESPTWTDCTSYLKKIHTKRGRLHELDQIQAGTAELTLDNTAGDWWRDNSNSVFYAAYGYAVVKPLTLVRLRGYYNGSYYPIFYGMIESIPHGWLDVGGFNPEVDMSCVDFFKVFTRYTIPHLDPSTGTAMVWPAELSGTRIIRILDYIWNVANSGTYYGPSALPDDDVDYPWPSSLRSIDAGQVEVAALSPPAGGSNALDHMLNIAEAEGGLFFQGMDPIFFTLLVQFQDSLARQTYTPYETSQATFNDDDTAQKYVLPELVDDDTFIYNEADYVPDASVSPTWAEVDFWDSTFQLEQGPRVLEKKNSIIQSRIDAIDQALVTVLRYSDSFLRCQALHIYPQADPANLFPIAFMFDISYRITLNLNDTRNPAMLSQDYNIEAIEYNWSAETNLWETIWQLWKVNQYRIFNASHNGYIENSGIESMTNYYAVHDAAVGNGAFNDTDPTTYVFVGQQTSVDGWLIDRGYLEADTTSLLGLTVVSAGWYLHINSNCTIDRAFDIRLVDHDSVVSPVTLANYHDLLTEDASYGALVVSTPSLGIGWIFVPINATGIAALNAGGISRFGLKSSQDINDSPPSTWNKREFIVFDGVGSANPPVLMVQVN